MAIYLNTNIPSLIAQNNLSANQSVLSTAIQQLSSGMRINSAADDPAGFAIATRMGSQINGMNAAVLNANDGVSLAQTAGGAMTSITNDLQSIRSLAVEAANATNSSSDLASLNSQATQLLADIQQISTTTNFNGVNLLDGSFQAQSFQVGANAGNTVEVTQIGNMQTSSLGNTNYSSSYTTTGTATTGALSAGDLTLNGFQVGASVAGSSAGQTSSSAFAIAQAINNITQSTGVTAVANANTVTGTGPTSFMAIAANTFSINGINIGAVAAGGNAQGEGANIAAAVNQVSSETGVTATANALTGALTFTAKDGRDINFTVNTIGGAAGLAAQLGLSASQLGSAPIAAVDGASASGGGTIVAAGAPGTAAGTIAAGALVANGVNVGAVSLTGAAYNAGASSTAGTAGSTLTFSGAPAGTTYQISLSGSATGTISFTTSGNAATDAANFATLVNAAAGSTVLSAVGATDTIQAGKTLGATAAGIASDTGTAVSNAAALTALLGAANGTGSQLTAGLQASGGAQYNGQQIAAAINTALASATGGAAVNGTASANAATGQITITSGSGTTTIGLGGTSANLTAAALDVATIAAQTGFNASQLGSPAVAAVSGENHGTITLTSSNSLVIGGANASEAGLTLGSVAASTSANFNAISNIDLTTAAGATAALSVIDGALTQVNTAQAEMGGIQNRFTSVVSFLQNTIQNLTQAQSRIQSTDYAQVTSTLTRSQILQQAGTAMLAQANAMPNTVLALLK
jgi:flagellin